MTNEERLQKIQNLAVALRLAIIENGGVPNINVMSVCSLIDMFCKLPDDNLSMIQALYNREMSYLETNVEPKPTVFLK